MNLRRLQNGVAICRLSPSDPRPDWAWQAAGFVSITRTRDEWSVACAEDAVPPGVPAEPGWSLLQVVGPLDFSLTGILASLAAPLAAAGISIFALATWDTDYLLIKSDRLEDAVRALEKAGHSVEE